MGPELLLYLDLTTSTPLELATPALLDDITQIFLFLPKSIATIHFLYTIEWRHYIRAESTEELTIPFFKISSKKLTV